MQQHSGVQIDGGELVSINDFGCWEWLGGMFRSGYGCYKRTFAHRVFYEMRNGAIKKDHQIHHRCSNKRCVNPDHLIELDRVAHQKAHREMRTHCKNGHEYTPKNTRIRGGNSPSTGSRICRACHRAANLRSKRNTT